jgi:hypothetical protein
MASETTIDLQEAHQILDRLSPEQFSEVARLMVALTSPPESWDEFFANVPPEDEELSPGEIAAILASREQAKQGKLIPHEEILREFGLLK